MDLSALISYFLKSKQNLSFRQTQTQKAEQQTLPQFITQKKVGISPPLWSILFFSPFETSNQLFLLYSRGHL